jgi:hypothetical protein
VPTDTLRVPGPHAAKRSQLPSIQSRLIFNAVVTLLLDEPTADTALGVACALVRQRVPGHLKRAAYVHHI